MTAPLIAPLIPPRARPGGRERGRPGAARRLPVAAAPEVPAVPDDVVYGFGRMDESGRVADRAMTSALGWQPGDRLTLTAAAGVVIARRDPGGMVTMPSKPCLVIPATLRRRCGLRPGAAGGVPGPGRGGRVLVRGGGQALRAHSPVPAAKGGGHEGHKPGRLPADCRGGGAGTAGADGPVPGGPERHPAAPQTGADLRRVRPGGVGGPSATAPAGYTARTGTGSSTSGVTAAWTSPPRRRSGS